MTDEEISALPLASAKTLPHSIEAEESLLAACMIDAPEVLARCFAVGIAPASFYASGNGAIFAALLEMHAAGQPIDPSTAWERLTAGKTLAAKDWPTFLALTSRTPTTIQAGHFAERVRHFQIRREVARLASTLAETALAPDDDDGQIARQIARLSMLAAGSSGTPESKWPTVVAECVAHAERIIARAPEITGATVNWPWPAMDRFMLPMNGGELVVLAARPSVGKSSMTRAVCLHLAFAGRQVLLLTLEDSRQTVAQQGAASRSRHSFTRLAELHPKEQAQYIAAMKELQLPNLHVFSRDNSLAAIAARAKSINERTPLALVAVDQLAQILDAEPMRGETKASAVGRVTRALKRLAVELGCPVLLPVQLNRDAAKQGNREPMLTDLRDSGDIEQDADRVIFLHRPDADPHTGFDQSKNVSAEEHPRWFVNAIQGKGRAVGAGQVVSFYFERATATFNLATR